MIITCVARPSVLGLVLSGAFSSFCFFGSSFFSVFSEIWSRFLFLVPFSSFSCDDTLEVRKDERGTWTTDEVECDGMLVDGMEDVSMSTAANTPRLLFARSVMTRDWMSMDIQVLMEQTRPIHLQFHLNLNERKVNDLCHNMQKIENNFVQN